jgi:hypothetical protein
VRFELTHALHTALAGPRLNHSAKVPLLSKVELLKYINMIYVGTLMEEFIHSIFHLASNSNDAIFRQKKKNDTPNLIILRSKRKKKTE